MVYLTDDTLHRFFYSKIQLPSDVYLDSLPILDLCMFVLLLGGDLFQVIYQHTRLLVNQSIWFEITVEVLGTVLRVSLIVNAMYFREHWRKAIVNKTKWVFYTYFANRIVFLSILFICSSIYTVGEILDALQQLKVYDSNNTWHNVSFWFILIEI